MKITPLHAFLQLGKYWADDGRSGISLPFAVAYWKWLHKDTTWGKGDQKTVEGLAKKIFRRKGITYRLFGEPLVLCSIDCPDVECIVFRVISYEYYKDQYGEDFDWDNPGAWYQHIARDEYRDELSEDENRALETYEDCYDYGPSRDYDMCWNMITEEDISHFKEASLHTDNKVLELAIKNGLVKKALVEVPA